MTVQFWYWALILAMLAARPLINRIDEVNVNPGLLTSQYIVCIVRYAHTCIYTYVFYIIYIYILYIYICILYNII